jgi:hypothetical protein
MAEQSIDGDEERVRDCTKCMGKDRLQMVPKREHNNGGGQGQGEHLILIN